MFSFQPKDINLNICQFYYVMQQQNWYKYLYYPKNDFEICLNPILSKCDMIKHV